MVAAYQDRLSEAMKEAGMDTAALARAMKLSYQAIRKVENGASKSFTAKNNDLAATVLGVSPRWLATGSGAKKPGEIVREASGEWPFSVSIDRFSALAPGLRDDISAIVETLVGMCERLPDGRSTPTKKRKGIAPERQDITRPAAALRNKKTG